MDFKNKKNNFKLQDTIKVNSKDHLEIANVDTIDLVAEYGTPLYIYDITTVRKNIQYFKEALSTYSGEAEISYASKAFSSLAMYQIINQEEISIDVVSGGELFLAKEADFPAECINFHGNNKSRQELIAALDYEIAHIIVDNFHELEMLSELVTAREQTMEILIRVTPGVEADTHKYIMTGQADSKFGFDLQSGQAQQAVEMALENPYIKLEGIHMHIGSQIFGTESYIASIEQVLQHVKKWQTTSDFKLNTLNIGGGFGIQHTADEEETSSKMQLEEIIENLLEKLKQYNFPYPKLMIEPGRSIVGEAGTTLYEIGSQKKLPNVRDYISVDGGMTDNIRPAFYDAKYFALLANRVTAEVGSEVSVAGKACESGDMLIWDLPLPEAKSGDILAVFNTGDYSYAMASNYNRIPRPAVVFVEEGQHFLAIKREQPEDFLRFENRLTDDFS